MLQGSPEWRAIKAGKISGSRFGAVMALNKRTGLPNKPRRDLIADLRRELETGLLTEIEDNEYMQHGRRCEPMACALYEFIHGGEVQHAAWIPHPRLSFVGFSPDGLLGDDGLLEIKCPFMEHRHLRTAESGECPDDYMAQVQGGLWTTGRQWARFVSFWEPTHDLIVAPVERDEDFIARLETECNRVWEEVCQGMNRAA